MSCEFRHRVYFNLHFSFRYFGILLLLWNVLSSPPRVKLNVKVRRNLVGKKMHKNKENSTTKKDSNSSDVWKFCRKPKKKKKLLTCFFLQKETSTRAQVSLVTRVGMDWCTSQTFLSFRLDLELSSDGTNVRYETPVDPTKLFILFLFSLLSLSVWYIMKKCIYWKNDLA